ncbi:hypothetical protein [Bacterioplanoides sp.]|uniref:hypothetical protein n=1 Tax=Bacterioplanoides sp. TaxID=2066072 RepID=UPI003AFF963C
MTDPIEEQRQIIDKLYLIVKGSTPENASTSRCRFDYDHGYEDGSSSVGSEFVYFIGEEAKSLALDVNLRRPVMPLVKELHAKMKAHTGGDWDAFTLTIEEDGRVTTKFEYPNQ